MPHFRLIEDEAKIGREREKKKDVDSTATHNNEMKKVFHVEEKLNVESFVCIYFNL